jgi:subtilisin family serine protease
MENYASPAAVSDSPALSVLDLVKLPPLMGLTSGRPDIAVGLIDGPVAIDHPDLRRDTIREVPGRLSGTCARASSAACKHGTFVAGILCAKRGSVAPGICPRCTLLVRPIFAEADREPVGAAHGRPGDSLPSATAEELGKAIVECIEAGARLINLSAALAHPTAKAEVELNEALDYAARRGVIVVAASGNQGTLGRSAITSHPWVIPVVACDLRGRPLGYSNLGHSIGRRGLRAPGDKITSLGSQGQPLTSEGTSVAAPFVTGALALLWSLFPRATAAQVNGATVHAAATTRTTVVPPLLDAWRAYQFMKTGENDA